MNSIRGSIHFFYHNYTPQIRISLYRVPEHRVNRHHHHHHRRSDSADSSATNSTTEIESNDKSHNHSHSGTDNINIRAAVIHVIGDFIQSVGVFLAAVVIYYYVSSSFY